METQLCGIRAVYLTQILFGDEKRDFADVQCFFPNTAFSNYIETTKQTWPRRLSQCNSKML
jgi:hypothetical protein